MKQRAKCGAWLGWAGGVAVAACVSARAAESGHWGRIAPLFAPPAAYANQFGEFRSPLLFENGQPVKTAADWMRRRAELLHRWHEMMGPWPALLQNPKLEIVSETRRENFRQRRVRVEIAAGKLTEGWLLVPDGQGPFPAVLVPFYEPETSIGLGKAEFRAFGLDLARRGFVTLSIGSPGGDARQPDPGWPAWQPLSFLAYVAANCHTALAQLPDVDARRIGVVGHSYGGKWAMFAACLDDRFAAAAWSDPGIVFDEARPNVNYWEPWYLGRDPARAPQRQPGVPTPDNPRTGAYKLMRETGRDLHELHALMAPRPFLVSGGSEDPPSRWLALNHAVAVNRLLGHTNRVAMSNRPAHSPDAESNEQMYSFFEHFLKSSAPPPGRGDAAPPDAAEEAAAVETPPAPLSLAPVYRLKGAAGQQRFTTPNEGDFEKLRAQLDGVAFRAVVTNPWPAGLVPVFALEKSDRIELRRQPPRGQENSTDPLFFALPAEDEPDAVRIAGRWNCEATRGDGTKTWPAWELGADAGRVFGRFDQGTEYRFAYLAGGTFRANRLDLRVEYTQDAYLLTGEWRDGKLTGTWRHAEDLEHGAWEAVRKEVVLPAPADLAPLYEWRRPADDARRYAVEGEAAEPGWERASRPLCLVWRAAAEQGSSHAVGDVRWEKKPPWSDPGFFPIAVWLQNPARAAEYRRAGFNTYVGLWRGPTEEQLAALQRAGMKVICAQNETGLRHRDDPTIIAWMHGDEPDNAQSLGRGQGYGPPIPPARIVADYERLRAADPSRPVLLNLGQGVAWDNWIGRGVRRNHPEDYPEYVKGCDIASFDIYPAVHDHPEVAGKLWFVARGVERLVQWTGGTKPVWNCLECTRISNVDRKPAPHEVRAEAWMALVHGSRGLIYFVHQFKPTFREAALLDDPEMVAAVTALNRRITELAPVLNSSPLPDAAAVQTDNAAVPVALMTKRHAGATYLFAVAMRDGTTKATFTLRGVADDAAVEVIGEDRALAARKGSFSDRFEPWAVHLYRVPDGTGR